MVIYEGGAIPQIEGRFIGAMSLINRVLASTLSRDTSTFRTDDGPVVIDSASRWFRPVDTKVGPDGAIYFADWCDSRLSHLDPRDTWDKESGRVWRLRAAGPAKKAEGFDFGTMTGAQLIEKLSHPNKWHREMALRVMWDRGDSSLVPRLRELLEKERGQLALEALWAVAASGGFDQGCAMAALAHPNPMVRYWAVRLLGDTNQVRPAAREVLVKLARTEPDVEVRTQLASTARRLPAADAVPMVRELLLRGEDATDKLQPLLLWWAIERVCTKDRDAVLGLLKESPLWSAPIFRQTIASRLGQRFTGERSGENLLTCARLLALAPTREDRLKLVEGMDAGLQGNAVTSVPAELRERIAELWKEGEPVPALVRLGLRLGHAAALGIALDQVRDPKAGEAERRGFIELLAERREKTAVGILIDLLHREKGEAMQLAITNALQRFAGESVAKAFLGAVPNSTLKVRSALLGALCTRPEWALLFLQAVDGGSIRKEQVTPSNLLAIQGLHDAKCDALLAKHWSQVKQSSAEKEARTAQIRKLLVSGKGDADAGQAIFKTSCATCHTLFKEGGKIGPDLTGYERDNLDFMLPAIVDPNLAIREEFTAFTAVTRDGQVLVGFLEAQTPQSVTMRDLVGQKLLLSRADLQSLTASPVSLMPEGLLEAMSGQQIRDLFAFLIKR